MRRGELFTHITLLTQNAERARTFFGPKFDKILCALSARFLRKKTLEI